MPNQSLISLRSNGGGGGTLVCFPYACGNASMYYRFAQAIDPAVEVLAAVMPGHGGGGEAPVTIEEFAAPFVRLTATSQKPVFVMGYSFGGFVAYELVRRLLDNRCQAVAGLLLISCPPPGARREMDFILAASEAELAAYTLTCYGFDLSLLTASDKDNYFRVLREDTRAMHKYMFADYPLTVPALVALGKQEEEMELVRNMQRWSEYLAPVRYSMLPGGHMLIKSYPDALARMVNEFVNEQTGVKR
ncbi:MAG TPA: alpha/beta fold hydrolase [Methylomusa anaerophila]|uniref:Surfactin synthase thioesterase subunit n=1 Tax=Methylomusa anaerophila TaxID=1930071 RepID=A0A348AEF2_9FIRM|nr:alpha/beta fold hydrolase [Methylomusa anaerophila]BBB89450.1 surfactin synthase thioesterase subunit [Methylomusa anaerophila]HML89683.1 alpha/beta fold hydrolase [Methylomusa anaerophila]